MWYAFWADVIVTIHFAFVAFVVVGQLGIILGLIMRWRWARNFWFRLVHLMSILTVGVEAATSYTCPLTDWERNLRVWAGQEVSDASFVGRLMNSILFYDCPQSNFEIGHMCFAGLVLLTFLLGPPRKPGSNRLLFSLWPSRRMAAPGTQRLPLDGPHPVGEAASRDPVLSGRESN